VEILLSQTEEQHAHVRLTVPNPETAALIFRQHVHKILNFPAPKTVAVNRVRTTPAVIVIQCAKHTATAVTISCSNVES